MKLKNRKLLYLPIEIKQRELLGKILLGCYASNNGFFAILGKQGVLRKIWKKNSPGIFFHKDTFPSRVLKKDFSEQIPYGNKFVALDEESLIIPDEQRYLNFRASKPTIDILDYMFLWGDHQRDVLRSRYKDVDSKLVVSGNPRLDLLSDRFRKIFYKERDLINNKFGKIILINSNGISTASIWKEDILIKKRGYSTKEHKNYKEKLYKAYISAIKYLSQNFSDYTIIIRPHPVEKAEKWRNDTQNIPNVRIIKDGSVTPYILSASIVIHNNCTTGIEAFMLDVPVVSYIPFDNDKSNYSIYETIPNQISFVVKNEEELVDTIKNLITHRHNYDTEIQSRKKWLQYYLTNIDEQSFSSEIIVDYLNLVCAPICDLEINIGVTLNRKMNFLYSKMKFFGEIALKGKMEAQRHKSEDISYKEVLKYVYLFQRAYSKFQNVHCVPYYDNSFVLFNN
jgi:surface carbohydrate biosynthesis protein